MLLPPNNYAFAKTPSYPPVRGRLDTETSLEEERNARMKEMKKETQERKKGRNARKNERKKRKNEWKEGTQEWMKGRNVSGERNLSSPKGDKRGARIWPPPYRGIRGGLRVFFFSFYLYIFILYIKKKINKNNNKWCGKSGKGGISYWCSIRIVIYTLWISGGDGCGKGNDKCGFLHMMENG